MSQYSGFGMTARPPASSSDIRICCRNQERTVSAFLLVGFQKRNNIEAMIGAVVTPLSAHGKNTIYTIYVLFAFYSHFHKVGGEVSILKEVQRIVTVSLRSLIYLPNGGDNCILSDAGFNSAQ